VALFALFCHDRLILLVDTAVAVRFDGAGGVPLGVVVGVGVGVGVELGVGLGVAVGVAVGIGVVPLIWTILATEGTPFEFRMNSM
jgi:hypothetical protein